MSSNPLESRALPGTLWEKIPFEWISWDVELQDKIAATIDLSNPIWMKFKIFTERPIFIFIQILILSAVVWALLKKNNAHLKFKNFCLTFFMFVFLLAASDLTAAFLKLKVGRLKPHVDFFNPNLIPALSFPSNHATNTMALFVSTFLIVQSLKLKSMPTLVTLGIFTVFIGLSRILLDEHHLLDVLAGWLLGGLFGILGFRVFSFLSRRFSL